MSGDEFGLVEKMFITDLRQWQVACLEATRMVPLGIVVRRTGPWVPLVQAGLLHYKMKMSQHDIVRLLDFYDIDCSRNLKKEKLMRILAMAINPDPAFVQEVLQNEKDVDVVEQLIEDPLFGAAFAELAPDDTVDYNEIKEKLKKVNDRRLGHDLQTKKRMQDERAKEERDRRVRPRVEPAGEAASSTTATAASSSSTSVAAVAAGPTPGEEKEKKQELWDKKGCFELANVDSRRVLKAFTARCCLPNHINCNKSLTLGTKYSLPEARRLIMQWCVDGFDRSDRDAHMAIEPRKDYVVADVPTERELLEEVNKLFDRKLPGYVKPKTRK
nr:hypothetical protein [Euryarchaeota archaeon]